jgi:hypothetical protein
VTHLAIGRLADDQSGRLLASAVAFSFPYRGSRHPHPNQTRPQALVEEFGELARRRGEFDSHTAAGVPLVDSVRILAVGMGTAGPVWRVVDGQRTRRRRKRGTEAVSVSPFRCSQPSSEEWLSVKQ